MAIMLKRGSLKTRQPLLMRKMMQLTLKLHLRKYLPVAGSPTLVTDMSMAIPGAVDHHFRLHVTDFIQQHNHLLQNSQCVGVLRLRYQQHRLQTYFLSKSIRISGKDELLDPNVEKKVLKIVARPLYLRISAIHCTGHKQPKTHKLSLQKRNDKEEKQATGIEYF